MIDKCRICTQIAPLTEDHVPPKGITGGKAVLRRDLMDYLTEPNKVRGNTKQNGTKFKTICSSCNSFMGSEFDPELISFAKRVFNVYDLMRIDNIKAELYIRARPARIAKAVVGHLVAGTEQKYLSSFDLGITEYFFDSRAKFPANLKMYCWVHPYNTTVIARDTAIMFINKSEVVFTQILKFLPLGFAITHDGSLPLGEDITDLVQCANDGECSIPLPKIITDISWPEAPADGRYARAILGGESFSKATYAIPKSQTLK